MTFWAQCFMKQMLYHETVCVSQAWRQSEARRRRSHSTDGSPHRITGNKVRRPDLSESRCAFLKSSLNLQETETGVMSAVTPPSQLANRRQTPASLISCQHPEGAPVSTLLARC